MDFGILASGLGGIFTGLVGPIVKGWMSLKQQKNQFKHDEEMLTLESQASINEINANIKRDEIQTEGRIDEATIAAMGSALQTADQQLFKESYMKYLGPKTAGIIAFLIAVIDMLRQSIRPTLTIYLVACTTWITVLAHKIIGSTGQAITAEFAQELFKMVVYTIVYLTVSCVSFWFCDRAKGLKEKISGKI